MKISLCVVVFWLVLLLMLMASTVSEKSRRSRQRHKTRRSQKKLKKLDHSADSFDKETVDLQVKVINYCKLKEVFSDRQRKTGRCIKQTNYELSQCSNSRRYQVERQCRNSRRKRVPRQCRNSRRKRDRKYCPEYVHSIVKKSANWEKMLEKRQRESMAVNMRDGRGKAVCWKMESKGSFVIYDSSERFCCGGQLVPFPGAMVDNCSSCRNPETCCLGCCDGVVFNRTTNFCNEKQIYRKGELTVSTTSTSVSKIQVSRGLPSMRSLEVDSGYDPYQGLNDAVVDEDEDKEQESHGGNIAIVAGVTVAVCWSTFFAISLIIIVCKTIAARKRPLECILPEIFSEQPAAVEGAVSTDIGGETDQASTNEHVNSVYTISDETYTHEQNQLDQHSLYSEFSLKISDLPVTKFQFTNDAMSTSEQVQMMFAKSIQTAESNITENLMKTAETQTVPFKESNMRDSLGNRFQKQFMAKVGDNVVQLPHSDVVMILPEKDLQENSIECHASSHTNIGIMRRKLKLATNENISSPIIEYVLRGKPKLKQHAVIKLPICGYSDDMRILRVESDQGADETFSMKYNVPRVSTKEDGESKGLDTFYVLGDSRRLAYIYTVEFSVYVCVDCGEEITLDAKAYIFAGVKSFGKVKSMVVIDLVFAGQLSRFKDYREEIEKDEREAGRKLVEFQDMKFKRNLKSTDQIEAQMTICDDIDKWGFVMRPRQNKAEVMKQSFSAKEMVQCSCKNGMPINRLRWNIQNKRGSETPDYLQCYVVVNHKHRNTDGQDEAAASPPEGDADNICEFALLESTMDSREFSREFSSRESQVSQQPKRDGEVLYCRKELGDMTLSSHFDSQGRPMRPAPEVKKKPACSFDDLGNRAVTLRSIRKNPGPLDRSLDSGSRGSSRGGSTPGLGM